jgi:hypothetical protein
VPNFVPTALPEFTGTFTTFAVAAAWSLNPQSLIDSRQLCLLQPRTFEFEARLFQNKAWKGKIQLCFAQNELSSSRVDDPTFPERV